MFNMGMGYAEGMHLGAGMDGYGVQNGHLRSCYSMLPRYHFACVGFLDLLESEQL